MDNTYVYATAAIGGLGCRVPWDDIPGCYRLAVARSTQPIGDRIFNSDRIPDSDVPTNGMEYSAGFVRPDGKFMLAGFFYGRSGATLSQGFYSFEVPPTKPEGHIDSIVDGVVTGWALERGTQSSPVTVEIWVNTFRPTGLLVGTTVANQPRPDVNQAQGVIGDHGFTFTLPSNLADGNSRFAFVYGQDPYEEPTLIDLKIFHWP